MSERGPEPADDAPRPAACAGETSQERKRAASRAKALDATLAAAVMNFQQALPIRLFGTGTQPPTLDSHERPQPGSRCRGAPDSTRSLSAPGCAARARHLAGFRDVRNHTPLCPHVQRGLGSRTTRLWLRAPLRLRGEGGAGVRCQVSGPGAGREHVPTPPMKCKKEKEKRKRKRPLPSAFRASGFVSATLRVGTKSKLSP